jgi:hypothetical protein
VPESSPGHAMRALGYFAVLAVFIPLMLVSAVFGYFGTAPKNNFWHSDFRWLWFVFVAALFLLMVWLPNRIAATKPDKENS